LVRLTHLAVRAWWLALLFGVLAIFAAPASVLAGDPLGGLTDTVTDTVTDTTGTVTDTVVEPVIEPVVDTVTETVTDTVTDTVDSAVEALPVDRLPEVETTVEVTLPGADASVAIAVGTTDSILDAAVVATIGPGLPLLGETALTADGGLAIGSGLDTQVGAGVEVTLPGGGEIGIGINPPPIGLPPPLDLPTLPPMHDPPVGDEPSVLSSPANIAAIGDGLVRATASDAARVAPTSPAPALTTRNDPLSAAARALERLMGQLGSGLLSQGGTSLAGVFALLIAFALVSPLTKGGVLPALAIWKPVPYVAKLDPPG
jgi:hypothetical protein